ncbi:MAG: DUF429 domain-containing protein [Pseudobdellovibrionaceae bacterium]
MPKKRLSSSKSKTGRTPLGRKKRDPIEVAGISKATSSKSNKKNTDEHHQKKSGSFGFVGISVTGGKADRNFLSVLEYFPEHKKIFLSKIFDKIKGDDQSSADLKIFDLLKQIKPEIIAVDNAVNFPLCLTCQLQCPGYEDCKESHIVWMWKNFKKNSKGKKPKKIFTPYTQRSVEQYFMHELEQSFILPHAMGANSAPLLARVQFLQKRLGLAFAEISPAAVVWRLGLQLGLMKSQLKNHRHSVHGENDRRLFLQALLEQKWCFIYDQDLQMMIENYHAFESFICALTAYLKFTQQTEPRPKDFPEKEDWIELPVKNIKIAV